MHYRDSSNYLFWCFGFISLSLAGQWCRKRLRAGLCHELWQCCQRLRRREEKEEETQGQKREENQEKEERGWRQHTRRDHKGYSFALSMPFLALPAELCAISHPLCWYRLCASPYSPLYPNQTRSAQYKALSWISLPNLKR